MVLKPWESEPGVGAQSPYIGTDLNGIIEYVDLILEAEAWRRKQWLEAYPDCQEEIVAACDAREKQIQDARAFIAGQLGEDIDHQHGCWMMLITGMAICQMAKVWQSHMAAKGVQRDEQIEGLKNSRNQGTTQDHWAIRKAEANVSLREVQAEMPDAKASVQKKEAAKRLLEYLDSGNGARERANYFHATLGVRAFSEWLKGEPQTRKR